MRVLRLGQDLFRQEKAGEADPRRRGSLTVTEEKVPQTDPKQEAAARVVEGGRMINRPTTTVMIPTAAAPSGPAPAPALPDSAAETPPDMPWGLIGLVALGFLALSSR